MFLNTSTPLIPVLNNRAKEHLNDDWSIEKEGGGDEMYQTCRQNFGFRL